MCAEGCYNFRVSQLINKGNSATMVLLKVYLTRHFIFNPKNCLKDTPLGREEITSSRSFDNSEIQRSSLLRETRGLPPALWMKWGGGICPISMRTGRKWPHWPRSEGSVLLEGWSLFGTASQVTWGLPALCHHCHRAKTPSDNDWRRGPKLLDVSIWPNYMWPPIAPWNFTAMCLRGDATQDEGTKHTNSPFSTSGTSWCPWGKLCLCVRRVPKAHLLKNTVLQEQQCCKSGLQVLGSMETSSHEGTLPQDAFIITSFPSSPPGDINNGRSHQSHENLEECSGQKLPWDRKHHMQWKSSQSGEQSLTGRTLVRFTLKDRGIPIPLISVLYSPLCDTCLTSPSWWEQVPGLGEQFKPQIRHHTVEPAPRGTFKHLYSFLPKLLAALAVAQEPNGWLFMSILVRLHLSKSHLAQQEKWNPLFQLINCHQIPSHFPLFGGNWVPAAQHSPQNPLPCRVCMGTHTQLVS